MDAGLWQRVERAVLRTPQEVEPDVPPGSVDLPDEMRLHERVLIERALIQAHGVQAEAARRLGISKSTLSYKLRKHHGLHPADWTP